MKAETKFTPLEQEMYEALLAIYAGVGDDVRAIMGRQDNLQHDRNPCPVRLIEKSSRRFSQG